MSKNVPYHIHLHSEDIPRAWYNIQADLKEPLAPPLNPATGQPASPEMMCRLLAPELVMQEVSQERFIDIPGPVLELYKQYRPSPLARAYRLEKALNTPARIYYKYEGNNPSGSHKLNSAIAQAYYNKEAGTKRLTTETGAGQWGTALAVACQMLDLPLDVYMVRCSAEQKPYRRMMMEAYGADVIPSPSDKTEAGRKILAKTPDTPGTLGMAISEAVEAALADENARYSLGSVLNHVVLHQTIIGQEVVKQLEMVDETADIMIGCNGGGSNFSGFAFPMLGAQMRAGSLTTKFLAVEAAACPKLTKGVFAYDFSDSVGLTPMTQMYTLGHDFEIQGIHAGGLRYHGDSPLLSVLHRDGKVQATAVEQKAVFEAALLFAREEIILPAPESAHAIAAAVAEAKACAQTGEDKTIVLCLSGNGYFDLAAYEQFLSGRMQDVTLSEDLLERGRATIPQV